MVGIIIGAIVVAAIVVAALGALFFAGRDNGQEQAGGSEEKKLTSDQARKIRQAQAGVIEAKTLAGRVRDQELQEAARTAADKAEKVIATMRKQPEEIRRESQFFTYYVPTMSVVLNKYLELQSSDKVSDETLAKTKQYMADMASAFDRQYDTMFNDEELDLTVEVEAMQVALKRDGMI